MTKYEKALAEIKGIRDQLEAKGLHGIEFRACDGAIGVSATPWRLVDGEVVHVKKTDPDYASVRALIGSWYKDYHDGKVAENSLHETDDGMGARLHAVEVAEWRT